MIIKPHTRGWAVWGSLPNGAGRYLMHTFTSLMAARSWVSDQVSETEA